ncbi:MAG: hypothetical protein DRP42_02550 [Tenericutes bacterium]|nr:MAG: hypothetical protein DRP42_02550 [Mycoplasmatota bacterium]
MSVFSFLRNITCLFSVALAEAMQAGWIEPMKKDYRPIPMDEKIKKVKQRNYGNVEFTNFDC